MSAIEELQAAIQGVASAVGPSVVGIGRHQRGSGVVIADGQVLTNAHNVRGEQVTVTFADGRSTIGRLAGIDVDGDLAVINVDTAGAKALDWGAGDGLATGAAVFGAAASPSGGTRVTFGTVSAVARAFRGPGGRRIGRQRRAHGAPRAGLVGRPDRRCRGPLPRPEHEPSRRGLLPRPAGGRGAARAGRRARPRRPGRAAAAWRRDRPGPRRAPAPAVGRPARAGRPARSATSRTAARRHAPASRKAT